MTTRRESVWFALLLAGYLASRLWALTAFPPFIDEAVHIEFARETLQGKLLAGSWGGRWLSIKMMAAFVALPIHPLLAARLATALAGVGALTACVLLGRRLYSPAVGLVAGFLYVVLPYALFYNRMALAETFAAAFVGAVLYLSLVVVSSNRRRDVAALAVALACMFLAKFYTIVLVLIPFAAVVLLTPRTTWRGHLARVSPALVPVTVAFGLMVWRGHGVHYVPDQSAVGGWWSQIALIWRNLEHVAAWVWSLLTPPVVLACLLLPLWLLRRRGERADLFLAAALFLSVGPFILAARTWFPRYLTPALLPLCVLLAGFACTVASALGGRSSATPGAFQRTLGSPRAVRAALAAVTVVILAWPLWFDALIIFRPERAPMPRIERGEFFEGWGAGYGLPELAEYLNARSLATPEGINIVRFFFWNQANQGLSVYLSPTPSLAFHTIDPTDPAAAATIARIAASRASFFVLNPPNEEDHLASFGKSLADYFQDARRVWYYPRGGSALEVWELRQRLARAAVK